MAWNTANVGNFDPFAYPREYVGDNVFSGNNEFTGDTTMGDLDVGGTLAVTGTSAFTGNAVFAGGLNATSAVRANSDSVSVICQPNAGGGSSGGAPTNDGRIEFRSAPAGDFTGTLRAAMQVDSSSGDFYLRGGAAGTSAIMGVIADATPYVNWQNRAHMNMASLGVGDVDATGIVDLTGQEDGVGANAALRNTYNQSIGNGVVDGSATSGWISARRTGETDFAVLGGTCFSSTNNRVNIGGGITSLNAATSIKAWTGATHTTATGTQRMEINEAGEVGFPSAETGETLHVVGDVGVTGIVSCATPTAAGHAATRQYVDDHVNLMTTTTEGQITGTGTVNFNGTTPVLIATIPTSPGTVDETVWLKVWFTGRTVATHSSIYTLGDSSTITKPVAVKSAGNVDAVHIFDSNGAGRQTLLLQGAVPGNSQFYLHAWLTGAGTSSAYEEATYESDITPTNAIRYSYQRVIQNMEDLELAGDLTVGGTLAVTGTVSCAAPTAAGHAATRSWTEGLGLWQKVSYSLDDVNRIPRTTSQTPLMTLNQLGGTSSNKWFIHIQFVCRTITGSATVVWLQAGAMSPLPSLPVAIADVVCSTIVHSPGTDWDEVNLCGIVNGATDYTIYFMDNVNASTAQFFGGTTSNYYSDIIDGGASYWVRTWARPLDDALTYT